MISSQSAASAHSSTRLSSGYSFTKSSVWAGFTRSVQPVMYSSACASRLPRESELIAQNAQRLLHNGVGDEQGYLAIERHFNKAQGIPTEDQG